MKTEVFCLSDKGNPAWKVRLCGIVMPHTWSNRGAAEAAIEVEAQRQVHKLCRERGVPVPVCGKWAEALEQLKREVEKDALPVKFGLGEATQYVYNPDDETPLGISLAVVIAAGLIL